MFANRSRVFMFAVLGVMTGGCVSHPVQPKTQTTSYRIPCITTQAETKASQSKGGIEISLSPESYSTSKVEKLVYTPADPSGMGFVMGPTDNTTPQMFATWKKESVISVKPANVRFMVKINNQLPRVFHGAGMVVQFNVGGQLQAVRQEGYQSLTSAIVPPRNEQEVEIVGPPLDALNGNKGIIGVFLYDVVTNVNEAGVVKEKQNFEWYFDYTINEKSESLPYSSGSGWMAVSKYQEWKASEAPQEHAEPVK